MFSVRTNYHTNKGFSKNLLGHEMNNTNVKMKNLVYLGIYTENSISKKLSQSNKNISIKLFYYKI